MTEKELERLIDRVESKGENTEFRKMMHTLDNSSLFLGFFESWKTIVFYFGSISKFIIPIDYSITGIFALGYCVGKLAAKDDINEHKDKLS